jgi:hypothetical protein
MHQIFYRIQHSDDGPHSLDAEQALGSIGIEAEVENASFNWIAFNPGRHI